MHHSETLTDTRTHSRCRFACLLLVWALSHTVSLNKASGANQNTSTHVVTRHNKPHSHTTPTINNRQVCWCCVLLRHHHMTLSGTDYHNPVHSGGSFVMLKFPSMCRHRIQNTIYTEVIKRMDLPYPTMQSARHTAVWTDEMLSSAWHRHRSRVKQHEKIDSTENIRHSVSRGFFLSWRWC